MQRKVDVGSLTAEETKSLFLELSAYLDKENLLSAISEIVTGDDREELIAQWARGG